MPAVRPIGFPSDIVKRIDLWNSLFAIDFFSIRCRLAEIAVRSWEAVRGASIVSFDNIPEVINAMIEGSDAVVCFVDDDDWFAPNLHQRLEIVASGSCRHHAVRWAGAMYDGSMRNRFGPSLFAKPAVSLYRLIRGNSISEAVVRRLILFWTKDSPMPVLPADLLFMTNNYGITSRFVREMHSVACVTDHVEASRLFLKANVRVKTLPHDWLSLTNKHPCSAGVIGYITERKDPSNALVRHVDEFVKQTKAVQLPDVLDWSRAYIDETRQLFEAALG